MFKKLLIGVIVSGLLLVSVTACGIREASTTGGPTVHMGADFFLQPSIAIRKGDTLTLVDDSTAPHLITNGSWINGLAKPGKETGAPAVYQPFNGNDSATIGPFNTLGIYHLYLHHPPEHESEGDRDGVTSKYCAEWHAE